jgi:phosphatidylglycerophosphatase A
MEALFLAFAIHHFFPLQERIILGVIFLVLSGPAVFFSGRFSRSEKDPDPSKVVIDEILGQILCLLWVPVSVVSLTAGFLLFRFFDIVKPSPARESEKLSGGIGIVCDDLIAGTYAGLSLKVLFLLFHQ